jgi:aminoglycoside 2''-phosphotransferase
MNPQELIQIIRRDTGLDVESFDLLLDGWDNIVLEVNDAFIFRFTRRREILEQHIKELELLPLIREHLTHQVPEPIYHQTDDPPYYLAYMKIPGTPITKRFDVNKIIQTMTRFIQELQEIDYKSLIKTPRYNPESWRQEYHDLHQRIKKEAYPILSSDIQSRITTEFKHFMETTMRFTPTLCHRDLTADHVLVQCEEIVGVIDWGDACIGDPAFDLTGLVMDWGIETAQRVSESLGYQSDYLDRAQFYSHLSPFYEYLYGKEINEEKHIQTGLEKIKIFSPII